MANQRRIWLTVLVAVALNVAAARLPHFLDIYWIDVEGGAATLVVTRQGQSVLMDAGWVGFADRDASRIDRVLKTVGLQRLDYLLISHFHSDHVGGVAALAKQIRIDSYIDHGELFEDRPEYRSAFDEYVRVAGTRRRIVRPGDRLALRGIDFTIVAADGQVLPQAAARREPNRLCDTFAPQPEDRTENARSLGYLLRENKFEFVNLGDISWNVQSRLACPINVLGPIDLFQVTHHGVRDDVLPQQMWAMRPTVAVMNNGPAKGAGRVAVETVLRSPGLEDLWALHRAVINDAAHNAPEELTANLGDTDGCPGAWIRARVNSNGTYTLTNSRNGYSKTYRVK